MELTTKGLFILLSSPGGSVFPGSPLRLSVPHQVHMETSLLETHTHCDPLSNIPGPVDAQRLGKYDVGEGKGSLGVIYPVDNTPPFLG